MTATLGSELGLAAECQIRLSMISALPAGPDTWISPAIDWNVDALLKPFGRLVHPGIEWVAMAARHNPGSSRLRPEGREHPQHRKLYRHVRERLRHASRLVPVGQVVGQSDW